MNICRLKLLVCVMATCGLSLAARAQSATSLNLPLYFEADKSQSEYRASGSGYQFLISASGAQIALRDSDSRTATAEMEFSGANPQARIEGGGEQTPLGQALARDFTPELANLRDGRLFAQDITHSAARGRQ